MKTSNLLGNFYDPVNDPIIDFYYVFDNTEIRDTEYKQIRSIAKVKAVTNKEVYIYDLKQKAKVYLNLSEWHKLTWSKIIQPLNQEVAKALYDEQESKNEQNN